MPRITSLLLITGVLAVFTVQTGGVRAQETFPQGFLDFLNSFTSGNQAGSATSTVGLTVSPNPIQTDELVIAEARTPGQDPSSLSFTWYLNGVKRNDLSGQGANIAAFTAPSVPESLLIRVESRRGNGATTSTEQIFPIQLSGISKAYQDLQGEAARLMADRDAAASHIDFALDIFPEAPRPGDEVRFSLRSFQFDAGGADITWFVNDKRIAGGRGVIDAATRLGGSGTSIEIRAVALTPDGKRAEKSRIITPSDIRFYWWTDSYVPAWYKGKALPTPGTTIIIQARPTVPASIAASLSYTWLINGEVVSAASGKGKSMFPYTIATTALGDEIRVKIANAARSIQQEATFLPPIADYQPLLYEVQPLEGIDTAKTVRNLTRKAGSTFDVRVEPFFVPKPLLTSLNYRWSLDGEEAASAGTREPRLFTLTSTAESLGRHTINLLIESRSNNRLNIHRGVAVELE